jgi:DNA-binding transcriptional regulator YiaG
MSEHDEWGEFEDEDAIVLEALAQMQAHGGDDEFDEALREAYAAVAQEALALKERRMQREAAVAWADEQAQIAVERRRARKEAERRDKAHREAEEAGRQQTRERARRDEARREAEQRRHREGQPPLTGADLSAWRKRLGLNQQAAALRLGVAQGTISKAERRGAKPLGPALQRALKSES